MVEGGEVRINETRFSRKDGFQQYQFDGCKALLSCKGCIPTKYWLSRILDPEDMGHVNMELS